MLGGAEQFCDPPYLHPASELGKRPSTIAARGPGHPAFLKEEVSHNG